MAVIYWSRKGVLMKTVKLFLAATLLGIASAGAQINMPNPQQPGGSYDSAVRIIATNDFMIDRFIARWLRTHYPDWNAHPHEFQEMGNERYAVVYITSPNNNPGRRVYFRVLRSPNEEAEGGAFPL
jgi:hypothetical protein